MDGCERRIEAFVKIQKKKNGGGGGGPGLGVGVRVAVNEELKFFLGGSGLVGQGGCERRIEVLKFL